MSHVVCSVHALELRAWQFCTLVPSLVTDCVYFPKVPQALAMVQGVAKQVFQEVVLFTILKLKIHSLEQASLLTSPSSSEEEIGNKAARAKPCATPHPLPAPQALHVIAFPSFKGRRAGRRPQIFL